MIVYYSFTLGSVRVYSSLTRSCIAKLVGHKGEISKVRETFNPISWQLYLCIAYSL